MNVQVFYLLAGVIGIKQNSFESCVSFLRNTIQHCDLNAESRVENLKP